MKRFMGRGCGALSQTTSVDRFRPRICFLDVSYDMDSVVCDRSVVLIDGTDDGSSSPPAAALPALEFKLQSSMSILVDHLHRLVGMIASDSPSDAVEKVMDKLRSLICLVGRGICVVPVNCIFRVVDGDSSRDECTCSCSRSSSCSCSCCYKCSCSCSCCRCNAKNKSNRASNFDAKDNNNNKNDKNNSNTCKNNNNNNNNVDCVGSSGYGIVDGCKGADKKNRLVRKRDSVVDASDERSFRWSNPSRPRSRQFPRRFDLNCLKSCAKVCCARHLFDVLVDENVVLVYRQANHVFSRIDGFYGLSAETVCSVFRERVRDLYRRYCGVLGCDETTGCSVSIGIGISDATPKLDRAAGNCVVSSSSPFSPVSSPPSTSVSIVSCTSSRSSSLVPDTSSSVSSRRRRRCPCPFYPVVLRRERFCERARWHPWAKEQRRDKSSRRPCSSSSILSSSVSSYSSRRRDC